MPDATTGATDSRGRPRTPRGEGDQLRTDLLEAAAGLIAEHGSIEGISLRAIARRTGVSPTAVYRHFANHDQLLHEAVRNCWVEFLNVLTTARQGDGDAFDALDRCGVAYAEFARENPGRYRVMFTNDVGAEAETAIVANATFMLLVELVQEMLHALDDGRSTHTVAVQVHTWIHGIVGLVHSHPDFEWPAIEQQLQGLRQALGLVRPAD